MHSQPNQLQRLEPRQTCRNPNCGAKLKAPTDNRHHAFCTVGCYRQFFRHRCVVCERQMERPAQAAGKKICGKRKCRILLRQSPISYRPMGHSLIEGERPLGSADKIGGKKGWREQPKVWKVIAGQNLSHANLIVPLDPETASRVRLANERFWGECPCNASWTAR